MFKKNEKSVQEKWEVCSKKVKVSKIGGAAMKVGKVGGASKNLESHPEDCLFQETEKWEYRESFPTDL